MLKFTPSLKIRNLLLPIPKFPTLKLMKVSVLKQNMLIHEFHYRQIKI